jgi:hypothetical protein
LLRRELDRDGDDIAMPYPGATMSNLTSRRPMRSRVQRASVLAAVLIAATVPVFALSAADTPSPAFAASASAHRIAPLTTSTSSRIVAPELSDSQRIAGAAPERALLALQAQQKAAADAAAAAAAAQAAAAQAAAAQAAAAQAAAVRAASVNAARAAAVAGSRQLNVWTSGFQSEINACRGGVDVTAHYGTPTVAEHWSCGGSSFPTAAGTIVTITGLDAGTYRVTGVVAILNAYTAHTNDVPRGYSLLFQTCRNGDSHYTQFVGLQRVG